MQIDVISMPFDGYGREGHQASAADTYIEVGLLDHEFLRFDRSPPLELPPSSAERGAVTGLINESALFASIELLAARVEKALSEGRFPLVVGGDCTALLGIVEGARAVDERFGLLFVDGHEDTTPLDVSADGEAANTEIGLLLGITGRAPGFPRPSVAGALDPSRLAMVGQRDEDFRRELNVGSVSGLGVWSRTAAVAKTDPAAAGRDAVSALGESSVWLHVDLDVLDPSALSATLVPGEHEQAPGGLDWDELTALLTAAVSAGDCQGLSVAIYDPELDSDRSAAGRIVKLIHTVLESRVR